MMRQTEASFAGCRCACPYIILTLSHTLTHTLTHTLNLLANSHFHPHPNPYANPHPNLQSSQSDWLPLPSACELALVDEDDIPVQYWKINCPIANRIMA